MDIPIQFPQLLTQVAGSTVGEGGAAVELCSLHVIYKSPSEVVWLSCLRQNASDDKGHVKGIQMDSNLQA